MYAKVAKTAQVHVHAFACTESLLSLLQICPISAKLCDQKRQKFSHTGAYGSIEWKEGGEVQKTCKKQHQKSTNICHKYCPKGNSTTWLFCVFKIALPGWSSRRPRTGSEAKKHVEMEALECNFMFFTTFTTYSWDTCWSCVAFVYTILTLLYLTVLYCTLLYYTILYYSILCYIILYYTILYYTTLCYTILCYTILFYTALYYSILYYTILLYPILYYIVPSYTTLHYVIYTTLYSNILYLTFFPRAVQYSASTPRDLS